MATQRLWTHRTRYELLRTSAGEPELRRGGFLRLNVGPTLLALAFGLSTVPAVAKNHYDRANARSNQVIVQVSPQDAAPLAAQYGLTVAGELHSAEGTSVVLEAPESLSVEQVEGLLLGDSRVLGMSRASLATLPLATSIQPAQDDVKADLIKAGDFTTPCLSQGFGQRVWSGYGDQEAVRQIRLHEGHAASSDCGAALVAVLDTGVDSDHPLLAGSLVAGYDFINETAGIPEETADLDQSVAAILEQSVAAILEGSEDVVLQGDGDVLILGSMGLVLDQSVAAILELDQSVAAILEQQELPFYGHGTMVAGLIRLTAPSAKIMPLRVFDGTGSAHVFDVVRAIHHAVDQGADVISMSFSMLEHSKELQRAVQYANQRGVVCVAAAGNQAERTMVYPAAFPSAIGVTALDGEELAAFANHGSGLVDVATPGTGIISTYPGGLYAASWGTSSSTPLVAGTMALLVHQYPDKDIASVQAMENDLRQGSEPIDSLLGEIGSGRLDVYATVLEAKK